MYDNPTKNPDTIRAFIAVPLPPDVIDQLKTPVDELRTLCRTEGIEASWSRPEGWHLTLKFLGPVAADRISPLLERLPGCAARHDPFVIRLTGFGVFPSARRPRVLWIGLEPDEGAASLAALARSVEEVTIPLGHPSEERPFSPHLTVARVRTARSSKELTRWLEERRAARLAEMSAEQIALMRSEAKPGGAVYTPVGVFSLAQSARTSQGGDATPQ